MMQAGEHAQVFTELALSIDQRFPGYGDACYGPQEIPRRWSADG